MRNPKIEDTIPLISIIIPVYNVESYLRRCIESVQGQTYHNIDIILVDDGSTDSSGNICEEYAKRDLRIRVIHKENGGLSDARNVGIKSAFGDYIAFVDSDDYICEVYIQYLASIFFENEADIVLCGYFQGEEECFPKRTIRYRKILSFDSKDMLRQWHGKYKQIETMAWGKLYKKLLFVDNNIYFPKGYIFEDVYTTHLLVEKAKKIIITNEKLYYYYKRKGSIINTISEEKLKKSLCAQNQRLDFFSKSGFQEAYERLVVQRQKQYMLNYYLSVMHGMQQLRFESIYLFKESYSSVCKFKETKIWEQIIFFLFNYFYGIITIFSLLRKCKA